MSSNNFKDRAKNIKKVSAASALIDSNTKNDNNEQNVKQTVIRKTTSLTLDVELFAKAKIKALQEGKKMYTVLEDALKDYLSK